MTCDFEQAARYRSHLVFGRGDRYVNCSNVHVFSAHRRRPAHGAPTGHGAADKDNYAQNRVRNFAEWLSKMCPLVSPFEDYLVSKNETTLVLGYCITT